MSNVYLIGYRGTGKSTVAWLLAPELHRTSIDADLVIEEEAGKTIGEIFAKEGEAGFRRRESDLLLRLSSMDNLIVATGGGVVLDERNRELLKRGRVVWLKAPPETLWSRMQADRATASRRPNLADGGLEEVKTLLAQRTPLYEACADYTIDTEGRTPEQVAALVIQALADKKA